MPGDEKFQRFHKEISVLAGTKKCTSLVIKRNMWSSNRGLRLIKTIYTPVMDHLDHL